MSGPDDTKEASELPSSHGYTECGYTESTELPSSRGYTATNRAVPSERKPGKQLSASLTLSKRENIHNEMGGKG